MRIRIKCLSTKAILLPMLMTSLLLIQGCGSVVRQLTALQGGDSYPASNGLTDKNNGLDLNSYKSVQSDARPFQRNDIAIAIAASGGGYRAANLTAGVMLGLEQLHPEGLKGNVLQEVDYFSTVSGGGFPVALYMSALKHHMETTPQIPFSFEKTLEQEQGLNRLAVDYSDELFFGRLRSYRLESKIDHTLLMVAPHRELTLGDIFISKTSNQPATLPIWVTNSAVFQNLTLFPFTPDRLAHYHITGFTHHARNYPLQTPKPGSQQVYGNNLPMSVAVTASAAFPYAIDGTTLTSHACDPTCYVQLFDGGLIDNLGVTSALKLLDADQAKIKILIIIDAFNGDHLPYSIKSMPPKKFDLLQGVLSAGATGFRQLFRETQSIVVPAVLCEKQGDKVLTVYLDISKEPAAQSVATKLWITPEEQANLIAIGKKLVLENKVLQKTLPQLLSGDPKVGRCD